MPAVEKIFGDLGMAVGAVHLLNGFAGAVPLWIDIGVAFHTGNILVGGILDVRFIYSQRHFLTINNFIDILFFVTVQAFPVGSSQYKTCRSDSVGLMAVRTGGDGPWLLFPEFSPDNLGVDFLDPGVALHASRRDVPG